MGTSMGGMHTWLWGERYPDFMDALMPLASLPSQISGRNRVWRRIAIDAIRNDPQWKAGTTRAAAGTAHGRGDAVPGGQQPRAASAADAGLAKSRLAYSTPQSPIRCATPTRTTCSISSKLRTTTIPAPGLEKIRAPLLAINFADDLINPPELGILEREIKRVPHGRAIVIPVTPLSRGHGTHTVAAVWKEHLAELLRSSAHD